MDIAEVTVIVLAAGKGTRMKSAVPKVMHNMAGKPLIGHVLTALNALQPGKVFVVIGHGREQVMEYIKQVGQPGQSGGILETVIQEEQLGTAHAVRQALPLVPGGTIVVLSGDQPLLTGETLNGLLAAHRESGAAATVLTALMEDPSGLGRIVREGDRITGIIEEKDADASVRSIKEINTGTYCFQTDALGQALENIQPNNAQKEYYLTDVFSYLTGQQALVAGYRLVDPREAMGINDHYQLSVAEEIYWDKVRRHWMQNGVKMVCPSTILIDADVRLEADVTLLPNTWIKGNSHIKAGSVIGPQTTISSCQCGENCTITYSIAEEAVVGNSCQVGPYSRLRKGSILRDNAHIGNFVEIKNSTIGRESKASHLSYIGDTELGENVNVGAGTITCNYDGVNKNKTVVGDGVFIGSNANLVAPVCIGAGAVIGAGSTVTKDVPEKALAVERTEQKNINNWKEKK